MVKMALKDVSTLVDIRQQRVKTIHGKGLWTGTF